MTWLILLLPSIFRLMRTEGGKGEITENCRKIARKSQKITAKLQLSISPLQEEGRVSQAALSHGRRPVREKEQPQAQAQVSGSRHPTPACEAEGAGEQPPPVAVCQCAAADCAAPGGEAPPQQRDCGMYSCGISRVLVLIGTIGTFCCHASRTPSARAAHLS